METRRLLKKTFNVDLRLSLHRASTNDALFLNLLLHDSKNIMRLFAHTAAKVTLLQ